MNQQFHFLLLVLLSYFVFGVFGTCLEKCIPDSDPDEPKVTCANLKGNSAYPYQENTPGPCIVKEDGRPGRNALCCVNKETYVNYALQINETQEEQDRIAKIAIGALDGEFPHQVFLKIQRGLDAMGCGGTIYNKNYILTAAHCVTNGETIQDPIENVTVHAGIINNQNIPKENIYPVAEIIHHHLWNSTLYYKGYDIAILRLGRELDFNNPKIKPLKIAPSNFEVDYKKRGIFIGWGRRNYSGIERPTPDLHKSFVPLRTGNECQEITAKYAGAYHDPVERQLCIAGGDSGITVGQGDSGGPTICPDVNDGNKPVLCGITSYKQCTNVTGEVLCNHFPFPGVYTRVSFFADWIENMTKGVGQESKYFPQVNMEGVKGEPEDFLVRILGSKKFCDGTLVARKVVVTSASCIVENGKFVVTHTKTKQELKVVDMMTIDTYTNNSGSDVSKQLLKDSIRDNDLAILQLEDPVDIDFFPKIPTTDYKPTDGVELSFSSSSNQRDRRDYNILEQDTCQKSYDILNVTLTAGQICAVENYSGGSTCDRPLGSPLICYDKDARYLCGIASTRGCFFSFPNIFTNTIYYSSIIKEVISMYNE